jgi:genome maintenance exonuclease 1
MFITCKPKEIEDLKSVTQKDGKRVYTLPDGTKLLSVTTVIGLKSREKFFDWRKQVGEEEANRISRIASNKGTSVHKLCEDYLNNEPISEAMPDAKEMFRDIKPVLNRINNIHYQEQALWSNKLKLAGRVDCIAEFDGELSVIDFKTSKRVKAIEDIQDYFWQTTAYALMYEELVGVPIHNLVIIMAVQDNPPIIFKQKTKDHINGLIDAIRYYNRKN